MNLLTGFATGAVIAGATFGADSGLYRRCAVLMANGQTGFCGFLYSPLTALIARPLTLVSPTTAELTMTLIGVAILATGVVLETRGLAPIDRLLVAVAVLTFAPVVYELLLGQTTLLIAAALYPGGPSSGCVRNRNPVGYRVGLGPQAAAAPGPRLDAGLAATGIDGGDHDGSRADWHRGDPGWSRSIPQLALCAHRGCRPWSSIGGTFVLSLRNTGNFSMWPLTPPTLVLACAVAAATTWAILRDAERGFVAALLAGLLLAPYSLLYAFSILLLAAKPAFAMAPRATRVLALTANLAGAYFLVITAWAVAGLAACLGSNRTVETQVTDAEP